MSSIKDTIWANTWAASFRQNVQEGSLEAFAAKVATREANSAVAAHEYAQRKEREWLQESDEYKVES